MVSLSLPRSTRMSTSLSGIGMLWSCLSFLTAAMVCVGFYIPHWLHGRLYDDSTDVFIGLFRRCNYLRYNDNEKHVDIILECGRYASFNNIPSVAFKICTVMVGVAGALSLTLSFIAVFACCITDVFSEFTAKIAGFIQLICALLVSAACALYPHGWNSDEVREVCGSPASDQYNLGGCNIQWGYYMTIGAALLLYICSLLSLKSTNTKAAVIYNV